ncbi:MAG TPA: hypothetical protein P5560_05400 [Thermotogota bacterium]|nr:hypothetical protein [Thermotogota bacterium]HRW92374.1 hypothetical protein [Thermotogota bacterium]
MKKAVFLALVLVVAFTFAFAQDGTITFLLEKGVVTAGEAVDVTFMLEETNVDDTVKTIEVLGNEVSDNVFVMLIKDAPNNAAYEATKEVDADAKKTVYYIRATELAGQMVTLNAILLDWNGEEVANISKEIEWDESAFTDVISLTPAAEGIYTVHASIILEDGTEIAMEEGQLVALKNYLEVPAELAGLKPYLSPANSTLKIKTGVEFMKKLDSDASTATHLSIYGQGAQKVPGLYWTWNKASMPSTAGNDVELVYDADYGTAYIKFKVLSEALEGDCCGTPAGDKWALWLAIGTGEVHTMYEASYYLSNCCTSFHYINVSHYKDWYWTIIKGDECKGWVKAIFYLDPADIKMWFYVILGTTWQEDEWSSIPDWDFGSQGTEVLDEDGFYSANLMQHAELNIFADIVFKDMVFFKLFAMNIPVTATGLKPIIGGTFSMDLGGKIGMGAGVRWDTTNPASSALWAAHMTVSIDELKILNGFPFESFSKIGLGFFAAGNLSDANREKMGFTITHLQLIAELGADITCCWPELHFGIHMQKASSGSNDVGLISDFKVTEIWGKYIHSLGEYGPVSLTGKLGVVYAMEGGYVDNPTDCYDPEVGSYWGGYGEKVFSGPAIGVAYEIEGKLVW